MATYPIFVTHTFAPIRGGQVPGHTERALQEEPAAEHGRGGLSQGAGELFAFRFTIYGSAENEEYCTQPHNDTFIAHGNTVVNVNRMSLSEIVRTSKRNAAFNPKSGTSLSAPVVTSPQLYAATCNVTAVHVHERVGVQLTNALDSYPSFEAP